ncbi:MAG TPA: hypothetical protein VFC81_06615 [Verrucomicrobiae bacterium]|nr:hypothetical protein [Verrucomicrobiae bacterium]
MNPRISGRALPRLTFPRLTFPHLWVALAILLPILAALLATLSTVDLAYNVRAGGLILDQGSVLRTDPFAFTTAGGPWLDQQWGAQVLLALGFRAGGWATLAILRAVLVGVVIGLVFLACRRQGVGLRVAAWLALASFVLAAAAMGLRPQLFGMVLFAAILAILAGRSSHPRAIWLIPLLVVPWASLHGSFIFAPVAVGVAWLEDVLAARPGARRILAVAIASVLASLVNPFGIGVWSYAFGLTTNPTIRRLISEWQPTTLLSADGLLLYGSMLAFAVIILVRARSESRSARQPGTRLAAWRRLLPTVLWLVFLGAVAASAERGIAWWALAAPVALAGWLGQPESGRMAIAVDPVRRAAADSPHPERASALNGAIVVVLVVVGVLLLPTWRGGTGLQGPPGLLTDAPAGITAALIGRVGPSDRIWNAQRWGSWLEFALPGVPIAVDSRIEVIPTTAWDDHIALSGGVATWQSILDRWGVTVVVASREEQAALIPLLRASPAWTLIHEDADGLVFVRR